MTAASSVSNMLIVRRFITIISECVSYFKVGQNVISNGGSYFKVRQLFQSGANTLTLSSRYAKFSAYRSYGD